jgi:hypothetical protein
MIFYLKFEEKYTKFCIYEKTSLWNEILKIAGKKGNFIDLEGKNKK